MKTKKQGIKSIRDNYSKGELAKEILKGLAVGGLIIASFALPNLPQVFHLFGVKTSRERYKMNRILQNLEKQKLIDIYEKGEDMVMEITERGKKRILKYKFDEIVIARPKKWDEYWRMIIFDIPERYKKGRDALTKKLKEMEIYPLQKSVFICPFDCRNEVDFVSEFFDVRKFVHYFVVKEIDEKDENFLRRYYNLK
ncbi:hypothetical protein KKB71_01010 [Patescibacteria group bacterium]|nr:hypothetical protein [Patescibacteria group bacterium]MBU2219045.1 hypothetical protein [Patescibacteria group bacterium]MBU2263230.1 hypothetical protein [Patescibacteria group bacterium]